MNIVNHSELLERFIVPPNSPIQPPGESVLIPFPKTNVKYRRAMLVSSEQATSGFGRIVEIDVLVPRPYEKPERGGRKLDG